MNTETYNFKAFDKMIDILSELLTNIKNSKIAAENVAKSLELPTEELQTTFDNIIKQAFIIYEREIDVLSHIIENLSHLKAFTQDDFQEMLKTLSDLFGVMKYVKDNPEDFHTIEVLNRTIQRLDKNTPTVN